MMLARKGAIITALLSGNNSSAGIGDFPEGVSVIVCAHNAARRIGQTLRHLARQQAGAVPWEVVVVDNASTDGTAEVARREWPVDAPAPLYLLHEPTLGYNHAADCGISNAHFSIIVHIHDDNWPAEDFIAQAATIFASDPRIGACGGQTKASFECAPPPWFAEFQQYYAVGPQSEGSGDITWSRGYLWGAGLCLRRIAWTELKRRGFHSLSSGRKGGHKLISGEDSEVCFALRLAGWKLWYSEDLCLTHFTPAARLDWEYLRRLSRSFGEASALHDCYLYPVSFTSPPVDHIWRHAFIESLDRLRTMYRHWPALPWRSEGNSDLLPLERELGRALELFRLRNVYGDNHRAVFNAKWRTESAAASHELRQLSRAT